MIIAFSTTHEKTTAPHTHRVHELIVCCRGKATLCTEGQRYSVSSRNTVLVPAGITHNYELEKRGDSVEVTFICFESKLLEATTFNPALRASYDRLLNKGVTSALMDEDTATETVGLAQILLRTLAGNVPFTLEKAGTVLNAILVNHFNGIDFPRSATDHSRSDEIQEVLSWLSRHFAENIDIDTAAGKAHMSRSVFTRYFRKNTNQTFSSYLANVRLKHSAEQLLINELPIEEVAYQSGYRNLGHFYSQFQKRYGMTPSQFRKMSTEMTAPAPNEK